MYTGIDLINISHPQYKNKFENERWMLKAYNSDEIANIKTSINKNLTFWKYWVAKEAAYKCIYKTTKDRFANFKKISISKDLLFAHYKNLKIPIYYKLTSEVVIAYCYIFESMDDKKGYYFTNQAMTRKDVLNQIGMISKFDFSINETKHYPQLKVANNSNDADLSITRDSNFFAFSYIYKNE